MRSSYMRYSTQSSDFAKPRGSSSWLVPCAFWFARTIRATRSIRTRAASYFNGSADSRGCAGSIICRLRSILIDRKLSPNRARHKRG
jgi:hypothetical protein